MDGESSSMTEETRTVTILDREINVVKFNETQFMLVGREIQRVQRLIRDETVAKEDVKSILSSMARVLNMLESRVVDPEDRDFLVEKMSEGELSIFDVMPIISAFRDDEDDAPVKPKVHRASTARRR